MIDKVKDYGKFKYVEPNDFLNEKTGISNMTHPYEDYCISVDLIVNKVNRFGTSVNSNYTSGVGVNSFNGEKISFFGGKDGFLTDVPGSVIYRDIMNKDIDGCRESLGISSINITYNSYFYPEVTINFIDVRGGGLMMPQEENYRREMINKNSNLYGDNVESFFSALFSFPYPDFILRVKGFYGKPIEYSLIVSEFKSSFNNQTGNFECVVKFIGRMFGMYTDIPMIYLLISPYCQYGGNGGRTIWQDKGFKFENSVPIPTLLDLKKQILSVNSNIESNINNNNIKKFQAIEKNKNLLNEIRTTYNKLKKLLKSKKDNRIYVSSDNKIMVFLWYYNFDRNSIPIKINESCAYLEYDSTLGDINFLVKELGLKTLEYNERNTDKISYFIPYNEYERKNDINTNHVKSFSEIYELNENKSFIEFNNKNSISGSTFYLVCKEKDFIGTIDEKIDEYNNQLNTLNNEIDNNINDTLYKLLGFTPSIKNIFKIVMAHLECFIEIYYNFISNITGVKDRTLDEYGISVDMTDIKVKNGVESVPFPPFPYFKNNKDNMYCYPEDLNIGNIEECELIDSFFNGIFDFLTNKNDIDSVENKEKIRLIPTCLSDLLRGYNDNNINPYANISSLSDGETSKMIEIIFTYFMIRFIQRFFLEREINISQGYDNMSDNESFYEFFGKCEAYNFWVKNKNVSDVLINLLKSNIFNSSNFIGYVTGDNDKDLYFNDGKYFYTTNKINKLLNSNKTGVVNHTSLNSNISYSGKFGGVNPWKDFLDKTNVNEIGVNSFNSEKNVRPYKLIDFIEEIDFKVWEDKLNSFDFSPYNGVVANKKNDEGTKSDGLNNKYFENYSLRVDVFEECDEKKTNQIFYSTEKTDIKYNTFKKQKNYKEYLGTKELYEAYNIYDKCKLDDIRLNNINIFFYDEVTPELILNLPFNFKNIAKQLKDGRKVIKIPYTLQLYLGMILYHLKNDDFEDFKVFYNNLPNTMYSDSVSAVGERMIYTLKILECLTRNNNNEYVVYTNSEDSAYYSNLQFIYTKFKNLKNSNFIDFLGLMDKYQNWVISKNKMGFEYFKNKFILKFKGSLSKDEKSVWEHIINFFQKNHLNDTDKIGKKLDEDFCLANDNRVLFSDVYSGAFYSGIDNSWRKDMIYLSFNPYYDGYEHLYNFFKLSSVLVVPYYMEDFNNHASSTGKNKNFYGVYLKTDLIKQSFDAFKNQLIKFYSENKKNETVNEISNVSNENKLSMYKTLKNLQDKFFSKFRFESEVEPFRMFNDDGTIRSGSEFGRFHFLNHFLNDVGDDIICNLEKISNLLTNIIDGTAVYNDKFSYSDMSLYSFIAKICEDSNMLLLSVPAFDAFDKENVGDVLNTMFTPISYNNSHGSISGPSYICFYPSQPSQYLDNPDSQYEDDGFDIADIGNYEDGPLKISDLVGNNEGEYNKIIPAFGVEYGSQKQSIFKNISINMDNPQTTEVAVANQFRLASSNNNDVRNLTFEGQDLYKIYSNYSYNCGIEMMGCSQIMPLMYFQLNNIPMFRGAYQIYHVEHNVTPGNMTTNFKGVRVCKTKMPFVKTCISLNRIKDSLLSSDLNNNLTIEQIDMELKKLPNLEDSLKSIIGSTDFIVDADTLENSDDISIKFQDNETKIGFNNLNPDLRQLIYCIGKDVYSCKEYGKMTLKITSTTRDGDNESTSDHAINGKPSERRKKLTGKDLNGNNKTYAQMGCAVDMYITVNDQKMTGEESVWLFYLIAINYTDYIRQLIWETQKRQDLPNNQITNVIHLASYGKVGKNGTDKTEIFAASSDTANEKNKIKAFSAKATGYKILPPAFLEIIKKVIKSNNNYVTFPNFIDHNNKPTIDLIDSLLRK